ncbi:hypothetical protein [Cellulomonas sp. URHB0016]
MKQFARVAGIVCGAATVVTAFGALVWDWNALPAAVLSAFGLVFLLIATARQPTAND